ncbi:ABC transporter ATP-binding protein [Alicycliphilus denitrificans]|uniref:ABC transporter ATP-binding protein n=1 Tax=Alicycliphilus denitrificans TaxID=179636 RepID=A0A420K979_9BURK|nr:ABC transporter ATP-binding protein [Alicycliphilus denitrificans]RKJ95159.1 ABC transporter ATP-binding protein [Alicycliphilus denitrificans]
MSGASRSPSSLVLKASHLKKSFGAFTATNDVSFEVHAGDSLAIIGPNGAGKSTLFDLLTGRKTPDAGSVELFGEPVTHLPPWQRVKRGIGRSFQVSSVFKSYTALENVQTGLMVSSGQSWSLLGRAASTRRDEALAVLGKVGLAAKRDVPAGDLSYGDQRTLELAVALSTRPRLLLLDEPTAGMGREESRECLGLIREIAEREQLPIVFVEHDMDIVFSFATRVMVLVAGEVLIDDQPQAVRGDARVKEAYFGEDI